jgi:hypothetical protein
VTAFRRTAAMVFLSLVLSVAGCGVEPTVSPPAPTAGVSTSGADLSAIACATADPGDVGELTGAWQGDDQGVYYIRQVGIAYGGSGPSCGTSSPV